MSTMTWKKMDKFIKKKQKKWREKSVPMVREKFYCKIISPLELSANPRWIWGRFPWDVREPWLWPKKRKSTRKMEREKDCRWSSQCFPRTHRAWAKLVPRSASFFDRLWCQTPWGGRCCRSSWFDRGYTGRDRDVPVLNPRPWHHFEQCLRKGQCIGFRKGFTGVGLEKGSLVWVQRRAVYWVWEKGLLVWVQRRVHWCGFREGQCIGFKEGFTGVG